MGCHHFFLSQLAACFLLLCITFPASSAYSQRALLATPTFSANLDLLSGVSIPAEIAVPSGNEVHIVFKAVGHQHYRFNGTQWVVRNATAKLYGSGSGAVVGRHFYLPEPDANGGQPTWQTFDDPHHPTLVSSVTARTIVAVRVDIKSITWNLLQATSHGGNTDEPLGHVTYVQRIKTRRGLPPSTTTGVSVGATHSSKYTSLYVFYVAST